MKFGTILAIASTMIGAANAQVTLAQKWNISDDATFTYDSLSFTLGYTVSDFISDSDNAGVKNGDMARFTLYDEGCKDGNNVISAGSGSGILTVVDDVSALLPIAETGASMDRVVSTVITLDPETISGNSLIYTEDTDGFQVTAEVRFCLRLGLHTKSTTSVEVNFLETLVTLNIDLTDGFEIGSIAVEPRDRLVRTANQVYLVEGFRCNAANQRVTDNSAINQGTVVKVCVKPDQEAEDDGIQMRSIDDFTWTRNSPNVITQPAIIGRNTIALNQLTTLDCTPGDDLCSFETILFAAFYTTPGAVLGSGVASMQFGTTNRNNRRLRSGANDEGRDLQEDDAAAAAEFELDFDVAQATAQGTSGAVSYGMMASMSALGAVAAALL